MKHDHFNGLVGEMAMLKGDAMIVRSTLRQDVIGKSRIDQSDLGWIGPILLLAMPGKRTGQS